MEDAIIVCCPNCLSEGKQRNIEKYGLISFCEESSCHFMEDHKAYSKPSDANNDIQNVSQNECPECFLVGKKNNTVKRGCYYFCEDLTCNFMQEDFSTDLSSNTISDSIIGHIQESFENTCNSILNVNVNKSQVFNWLRLPCGIKAHRKIMCAILIHLDIFRNEFQFLTNVKSEYKICETFSNNFHIDKSKLFAYNVIRKIYNLTEKISKNLLDGKDLDERLLMVIKNFDCRLNFQYKKTEFCNICGNIEQLVVADDQFVTIDCDNDSLRVMQNEILYTLQCQICQRRSVAKSIALTNVDNSVIINCVSGLRVDVGVFDDCIVSSNKETLCVVAVIECVEMYPYPDCRETKMSYALFKSLMSTKETKMNYVFHFRNSSGWYSLGSAYDFLCSPTQSLVINNPENIRFVILGQISDSSKYTKNISNNDYLQRLPNISETSDFLSENDQREISIPKINRKRKISSHSEGDRESEEYNRDSSDDTVRQWLLGSGNESCEAMDNIRTMSEITIKNEYYETMESCDGVSEMEKVDIDDDYYLTRRQKTHSVLRTTTTDIAPRTSTTNATSSGVSSLPSSLLSGNAKRSLHSRSTLSHCGGSTYSHVTSSSSFHDRGYEDLPYLYEQKMHNNKSTYNNPAKVNTESELFKIYPRAPISTVISFDDKAQLITLPLKSKKYR